MFLSDQVCHQKSRWCPIDRPLQPTPKQIAQHLLTDGVSYRVLSGARFNQVVESESHKSMPFFGASSKPMGDIRQEAQRLGRILRPKPQATTTAGGFNVPWFARRSKGTRSQGANIVSLAKMKI